MEWLVFSLAFAAGFESALRLRRNLRARHPLPAAPPPKVIAVSTVQL